MATSTYWHESLSCRQLVQIPSAVWPPSHLICESERQSGQVLASKPAGGEPRGRWCGEVVSPRAGLIPEVGKARQGEEVAHLLPAAGILGNEKARHGRRTGSYDVSGDTGSITGIERGGKRDTSRRPRWPSRSTQGTAAAVAACLKASRQKRPCACFATPAAPPPSRARTHTRPLNPASLVRLGLSAPGDVVGVDLAKVFRV